MVFTGWEPTENELLLYYGKYPAVKDISQITIRRYDELLDKFERYREQGTLLEVGCGGGHFLARALLRGWKVRGTEYGTIPIEACRARGIDVFEGPLDIAAHPAEGVDIVCSFEVIEHVAYPNKELDKMISILRPGGLLYLTTPNFNCLARRIAPETWNVANYPEHLNYFTTTTLGGLLESKEMRKEWAQTTGVSLERWLSKHNTDPKKRSDAKRAQETLRENLEKPHLKIAKRLANGMLDLLNVGDSMKMGYRKALNKK